VFNGIGNRWIPVVILLLGAMAASSCVTVGEYERLKDQLAQTQDQLDQKNHQIEELDAGKKLYEEKSLSLEDELKRYQKHSADADKMIEDLRAQLAARKEEPKGKVMEGVELFKPTGSSESAGIRLSDEILFDSGSISIKPAGKQALNWVIKELKKTNGKIEIFGHTDTDPVVRTKNKYPFGNIQLSVMRAISVEDYLRKNGIHEERMSVAGFGPFQPLGPNDTPENKKKNRRVEIILHAH